MALVLVNRRRHVEVRIAMSPDAAQDNAQVASSVITWFAAERPVEGTVFVKPPVDECQSAEGRGIPHTD
jgi:hypothetical protein